MEASVKFTERESTPEKRQDLINKARAWSVAQGATPSAEAEELYSRYVAGSLTLQGITDALKAAHEQRHTTEPLPIPTSIFSVQAARMEHERVVL